MIRFLILAALLACTDAAAAELKSQTLFCLSQARIDEAVKALDRGDAQWLQSVGGCFVTKKPMKMQRVDCSWRTCQVRVWPEAGGSAVVYVPRDEL